MARQYFVIKTPKGLVAGVSRSRKVVKTTTRTKYIKAFASFASAHSFVDSYVHSGYGMSAQKAVILPYSK